MNDWDLRLSLLKKIADCPLDGEHITADTEYAAVQALRFLDLIYCVDGIYYITKSGRVYLDGMRASNLEKINDNT